MSQKIKNYKVYKMSLTTLSPIFIGSGEVLNKSMYVYNDKEIMVIDERKLIKKLSSIKGLYESFLSECYSGNLNLTDFLHENLSNYENIDIYKYKIISYSNIKDKKLNNINTFIKSSNGKPYIPGSSIKGAIRTAIITNEIRHSKEKYTKLFKEKDKNAISNLKDFENNVLTNIFANFSDKFNKDNDCEFTPNILFKFLSVSDTNEVPLDNLFIGKQHDFTTKGNKLNELPIFMEFIKPQTRFNFTISIDNSVINYFDITNIERSLNGYIMQYIYCISEIISLFSKNEIESKYYELCNKVKEYPPNSFIGGHNGYLTKNILYSMCKFREEANGLDKMEIINMLKSIFPQKHSHIEDAIMSPRTLKLTKYDGKLINIGICNIKVEEELC